jgi:hypothetical protein
MPSVYFQYVEKSKSIWFTDNHVTNNDIIHVYKNSFTNDYDLTESLDNLPNIVKFVLYDETRKPIAMSWIESLTSHIAFMSTFCVVKSHRNKGIGTLFMHYIKTAVMPMLFKDKQLIFDSFPSDEISKKLYTKSGCRIIDTTDKSIIWSFP